jgi:gliding motility-associated-like protein
MISTSNLKSNILNLKTILRCYMSHLRFEVALLLIGLCISPIALFASITLQSVAPRIFTPNNDGYNDKAVFTFTNDEMLPIAGMIYDISGAEVGPLSPGTDPATTMLWDGKDSNGRPVPGGVYIFKIDFQGEVITGSVVVAR